MIWYVCFALAAAVAAVLVWILTRRKYGVMRLLYAMVGLVVMAYVIYIPPMFHEYEAAAAIFGGLINVLQIISLDADYLAFYDLINTSLRGGWFTQLYFGLMAAIHVLLPAISAMSVVTVLVRLLVQMELGIISRRRRPLYIFSDLNTKSLALARSIREKEKKEREAARGLRRRETEPAGQPRTGRSGIILLTKEDADNAHELRQELHCTVLKKRIEHIRALADKRPVYYYCIGPDKEENLNAALSILSVLSGKDREIQQNSHVYLFSADPSVELVIDSVDKGVVDFTIINDYRSAAYSLLEEHPLYETAEDGLISVLICGASQVGLTFLQAASWCGQLEGYRLRIRLVGRDIENVEADFKATHPALFSDGRYDIRFLGCRNELEFQEVVRDQCADATYVVVSGADDDETMDRAVCLRRLFYRSDPSFHRAPPIFAYIENSRRADAVRGLRTAEADTGNRMPYHIEPFGSVEQVYTYENLADSPLEKLARNIHLVYEDVKPSGDGAAAETMRALENYNRFEVNKNGSRANALHIRYKLAMMGLDYTLDPDAEEVDFNAYLMAGNMLEKLSLAEHNRWRAFLESEGWDTATIEQVEAYKASGISRGRHNCPLLKMHPYLCSNEELRERSQELQNKDVTVNDQKLIRRIPDILHDAWGVAHRRYKIIKKQ